MNYKLIYFLGIGGIGMSAIARYFKAKGFDVAGYDRTSTILTRELEAEGIKINYVDELEAIPVQFTEPSTLIVYTPAIPADNKQYRFFYKEDFFY
jgi:UDP-N-acetylmuramate--alanine ligase